MRQAGAKVDRAALIALAATAVGWFFMATLVVDFKWWQDSIRFYDLWAVIQDPGGRLSGIRRVHALTTAGFGLVCAAAILAPALSILYKRKEVWPTYLIPFVVMAISCAVLYARSSTNYIHIDANTHPAGAVFARIAQGRRHSGGEYGGDAHIDRRRRLCGNALQRFPCVAWPR